jgi:GntR family carbon starvation induced transcriptional regulator
MTAAVEKEDVRSQAERAYQKLRREIIHGDLMPGDRLRAADLQDRFSLGLTPIREALMRLTVEGLTQGESHRGSWVRGASVEELADLMSTRRGIERLCLAGAIAHGDAVWEAEIVAAYHLLSRTALPVSLDDRESAAIWERHHRAFHHALVRACGSDWLMRFWNMLVDHSERFRKLRLLHLGGESPPAEMDREHAQLMGAVLRRDAPLAADLMDEHLARTERMVAQILVATKTKQVLP